MLFSYYPRYRNDRTLNRSSASSSASASASASAFASALVFPSSSLSFVGSSSISSSVTKRGCDLISRDEPSRAMVLSSTDKVANLLAEFFSLASDKDRDKFAENLYCRWAAVTNRAIFERTFDKLFERLSSIVGRTEDSDEAYMAKILEFVRHLTHYAPVKCSMEYSVTFKKHLINKLGMVLKFFTAQEFDMTDQVLWGDIYDHLGVVTRIYSESVRFLNGHYTPDVAIGDMTVKQWALNEISKCINITLI